MSVKEHRPFAIAFRIDMPLSGSPAHPSGKRYWCALAALARALRQNIFCISLGTCGTEPERCCLCCEVHGSQSVALCAAIHCETIRGSSQELSGMSTPSPPASPDAALRSVHTANLPALFDRLHISLLVSTYQAGKVIVVRNDGGVLNTHFRTFAKPMGIAADRSPLDHRRHQYRVGVPQRARRGPHPGPAGQTRRLLCAPPPARHGRYRHS